MRGRRLFARLLALTLTGAMLLPTLTAAPALAASGHRIYTVEDLRAVANDPNGVYTLMNDLDLSSWNGGYWEPFDFSGTFYGNGHTIYGLQTNTFSSFGLFWELSGQCTIDGLTVRLGERPVDYPVFSGGGGIASYYVADSPNDFLTLRDCLVTGSVTGSGGGSVTVGGLVGEVQFDYLNPDAGSLVMTGCRSELDVSVDSTTDRAVVGGLIGYQVGGMVTVSACSYSGTLESSHIAGGIFGDISRSGESISGSVEACVVEGLISADMDRSDGSPCQVYAGGIIGQTADGLAVINGCQVLADVSAASDAQGEQPEYSNVYAGGIVGESNVYAHFAQVSDCTVSGDVTARGPGASAQGIGGGVSYDSCTVSGAVTAHADIAGYPAEAGGIAISGYGGSSDLAAEFVDCTVEGAVTAESLNRNAKAAGIVTDMPSGQLMLCEVYGSVRAESGGGTSVSACAAGIAGGLIQEVSFLSCCSYGDVTAYSTAGATCRAAGVGQSMSPWNSQLADCRAEGNIRAYSPGEAATRMAAAGLLLGCGGVFRECAFTGTAVVEYLNDPGDYWNVYAFCDQPSVITGIAHNTSGLELCPEGTIQEGPELPADAVVVVGSEGDSDYGQSLRDYYSQGASYFRVLVRGDSYPLESGFTITIDGTPYSTGSGNDLSAYIPEDYAGDVVVSKEGYYTYTLPNQYLRKYNWIILWPQEEGSTSPVIQSVLQTASGGVNNYLLSQASTPIYVPDDTRWKLDVQVDWQGKAPGEVWLQQGERRVNVVDGTTGPVALGTRFTVEGGTIYVCARNADGELTKVATTLKVRNKNIDVPLDVGDSKEVTSPNDIDFLAGTKMEFDLPSILEAEVSLNTDGTFTALIGVKSENKLYHKQAIGDMKELFSIMDSGGVGVDLDGAAEKLLKENHLLLVQKNAKFSIPVSLSIYGYLEGTMIDQDGNINMHITQGGALFKGSGGWSYTQLFPNGRYVKTGLTNDTQFKMAWGKDVQIPAQLTNTTSVMVGYGLGVPDVLSLGASGTGSVTFEVSIPADDAWDLYTTYDLTLLETTILGFEWKIYTIHSNKFYWVKDGKFTLGKTAPLAMLSQEEAEFAPIPRNYLERRSLELLDAGDGTFRDNVLPGADVQLAALPNGSLLAVWTDDPGVETRPLASNRSALYYALWKDGSWSEPALVEDDGTVDYSPVLRVLNGKAYLVWMNAGQTFTSEDVTLEQTAAAMDIRFASFDAAAGRFKDFAAVCSNQVLDMLPDVLLLDKGPAVVWLSETANDLYNRTEAGSLYAARCVNGTWEEPRLLASGLSGVDSLTVGRTDPYSSGAQVWYSAGDPDDAEAKEVCSYSFWWLTNGSLEAYPGQPTENDVPDTKPYWTEHGLSYYSDGTIQTPWGETGTDLPSDQYCLVSGDGVQAILFAQSGEDGNSAIYALFQDGGEWSEPIAVAQGELLVPSFGGAFDQAGNLHVFYSSVDVLQENADGSVETKTSLRHKILTPSADLAVTYADYQTASLIPGGALNYFITVENRGTRSSNYVQAEVFQGETSLGSTVFLGSLSAGSTQTFSSSCVLPSDYTGGALTVKVTALDEGFDETNLTDNTAQLTIYPADVSVEEPVAVWTEDDRVLVTALAANYGLTAAENLIVTLEDQNGQVLETQTIDTLAPGEVLGVEFLSSQLQPGELYVLSITEQAGERSVSDNRCPFLITVPEDGVTLSQSSCRFLEDGTALIQAVVDNPTNGGCTGTLVAALYQGDKLVETQQVLLTVEHGSTEKRTLIFDAVGSDCGVKLFYLETDTEAPLAPSVTFQMF